MSDLKHIIEPERQGLWISVTFIIALLALVVAFVGINRIDSTVAATQLEVLYLNKKIEGMRAPAAPAAPAPAAAPATTPAEPAAPATPQ